MENGVAEHHAGEGSGKAVPLLKAISYRKALALSQVSAYPCPAPQPRLSWVVRHKSVAHVMMGERVMHFARLIGVGLIGLFLMSYSAFAEEKLNRDGIWAGIDVGFGHIERSFGETQEDDNNLFLGFTIGYTLNPHFLIGVELSGWLFEPSDLNYPERGGEGLSQVLLVTRYYPSRKSGLFAKIGGGYVSHWNSRPGEPQRKSGWGLNFGGGYDVLLNSNWSITPFLSYSFGDADNQEHEALTVGIGFTWQ